MSTIDHEPALDTDQRVLLRGVVWADYERMLAVRGESAVPRIVYRAGEMELMSPSTNHEWIKKTLGRLVEAWSDETETPLTGYGSWTIRRADRERGLEPDECYVLGATQKPRPDLAIEVVLTSGSIDKLDVYRALGVPEVWFWRRGCLEVHVLRDDHYAIANGSQLLPELNLSLLARFVDSNDQPRAVREYRSVLRAMRQRP